MNSDFWRLRENVRYLSILTLVVLCALNPNTMTFAFLIFWILMIMILGNVRRLSSNNKVAYFFRMTLYFLPYTLPFALFVRNDALFNINSILFLYCSFAIMLFLIWLRINWKFIKLSLSDEIIVGISKESKYTLYLRMYTTVGAAICEELFFRGFILSIDAPIYFTLPVSVFFFMLSHYMLPWGEVSFTRRDHLYQITFGLVSGVLFLLSGSIIPSILYSNNIKTVTQGIVEIAIFW